MTDFDPQTSDARKRRELNRQEWEALITALAPDREVAGQNYEALRRRLMNLFAWEQCAAPDHLADEVLNRLARKLAEGAEVPHLDRFAFGIARLLIQEQSRVERSREAAVRELRSTSSAKEPGAITLDAMQACLQALPADRRDLIERYYAEDRTALARKLGISVNALRNRAMRIRDELFRCMAAQRDNS